jgi:preprotein translocase subunit YajC
MQWLSSLMLIAEDVKGGANQGAGPDASANLLFSLAPFVAIGLLFYFMLIRPQRKEQSRRQDMLGNVKKNDRVVTIGGIYGVVMNVHREADEVSLKVDETTNTKLRITLSSIARVISGEQAEEESTK